MTLLQRNDVSPAQPYAIVQEQEPDGRGSVAEVTTVFLTASTCPIGCTMCDLWQNTLTTSTPPGAIVKQIDFALAKHPPTGGNEKPKWIKLYNSGNFFDPASIPPDDYEAIAERCTPFDKVIVENHPRFGRRRTLEFRDRISGQLEVAVGLETVQPRWLKRLNKQMDRDSFSAYASWLKTNDVSLRVFFIVGVPGIDRDEAIRWARLSVKHAYRCGARHVSLIPARIGNGWDDQSAKLPKLSPGDFAELQRVAIQDVSGDCIVTIDTWDMKNAEPRATVKQIESTNLSQTH